MQEAMPPRPTQELSWRSRLASLATIRPLLRMVWETSPALVVASTVFRLFRALLPPRPTQELSWRSRLASLRNIRPLLRMVWETSPALVVASTVFRLFRALLPLAMLWVSKLIIDGVVAWITRRGGILSGIWKLVALELAPGVVVILRAR